MSKLKKLIILGSTVIALGSTTISAFAASPFNNSADPVLLNQIIHLLKGFSC